jgi:hypothetical protein
MLSKEIKTYLKEAEEERNSSKEKKIILNALTQEGIDDF